LRQLVHCFFFSSSRRHTRSNRDWSSDVCSSDLPDPSSQIACSIGGNVAENSGGVHCLKYGLTVHNVMRVRGFTIDGELLELGSRSEERRVGKACWACGG